MGDGSPASHEWFYELTRQTHKLRFVATGGSLKNILKDDDLTDEKWSILAKMITMKNGRKAVKFYLLQVKTRVYLQS